MGKLVKILSSGIGLAQEAFASHNTPKSDPESSSVAESGETGASQTSNYEDTHPRYAEYPDEHADRLIAEEKAILVNSDASNQKPFTHHVNYGTASEECDEEHWQLDGASETAALTIDEPPKDTNKIVDVFIKEHPLPHCMPDNRAQLPFPVILPQRRPRDKKRGFVRAYAPVLLDCGIDQATFLEFLNIFYESSKADPWLHVVNIAATGIGFIPGGITTGVAVAVKVGVGVGMEAERRTRTNSFMGRMNEEFFKPRGLYCMIMTYKPESKEKNSKINIISSANAGAEKQNKLKSSAKFIGDYFDRRAQASYDNENPESKLSTGQEQAFAGRYSNPNSAANSGNLVALLTGGRLDLRKKREEVMGARRVRKAERRGEEVTEDTKKSRVKRVRGEGFVKRVLKKDVLYLIIVNLPSEEEIREAGVVSGKAVKESEET